jgi:hypothetical protein
MVGTPLLGTPARVIHSSSKYAPFQLAMARWSACPRALWTLLWPSLRATR